MKEELRKIIESYLNRHGVEMSKQISSGGFFTRATFDVRHPNTLEEVQRLTNEGFGLEGDIGILLWNAILH